MTDEPIIDKLERLEPVLCGSCFFDTHNCQGVALRDMNVNLGTVPCECSTCCAIAEAPNTEGEGT